MVVIEAIVFIYSNWFKESVYFHTMFLLNRPVILIVFCCDCYLQFPTCISTSRHFLKLTDCVSLLLQEGYVDACLDALHLSIISYEGFESLKVVEHNLFWTNVELHFEFVCLSCTWKHQ